MRNGVNMKYVKIVIFALLEVFVDIYISWQSTHKK